MLDQIRSEKRRLRDSTFFKLMVLGGLALLLLIPLAMVGSLIRERQARRHQAAEEVASSWGRSQILGGPVLIVPFLMHGKDDKGKDVTWTSYAHFLPETLEIDGRIAPERRNRGIFEVAVYRADLHWKGTFLRPDFSNWRIAPQDILWDDAWLSVGIPDLRGIRSGVALTWGGRSLQFEPGARGGGLWDSGLSVRMPELKTAEKGQAYAFAFNLGLNGSQKLDFLPLGKQTKVLLRSSWPSPSFAGAFLPESREVSGTGFEAVWNVSWFGRGYPQQWRSEETQTEKVFASAFGVELFLPVDSYQKTERSVKYGVLFLLLTFLTFFLYEVFNPFSLHPIQYLLVGSAICLFYLLLLSLSEHLPFGLAYAAGAAATVLLIGGYSAAILRGAVRAFLMTAVLGGLYGYLYVLLQLEDYALLLGSLGLFLILALVMYLTRKIDWAAARPGRGAVPVPNP
ncbi:MAG TPA: cell envelope integrity protein CreD [Thermoanaerobaculia bacterium]